MEGRDPWRHRSRTITRPYPAAVIVDAHVTSGSGDSSS